MTTGTRLAQPLELLTPPDGSLTDGFRRLFRFRELLFHLTMRDVKIRYKQAVLGIVWAILKPLVLMVVFTLVFSKAAGIGSDGIPYPIFSYAGLLPWTLFSSGLNQASLSLVSNQPLIKNIYFPREVLPASAVTACVFDFAIASLILGGMLVWYGYAPTLAYLWLPILFAILVLLSFGIGLLVAALNVSYRDVKYVVPLGLQVWMYLTPVIYPTSMIPEEYRDLFLLNPLAGLIEGFRGVLVHGRLPDVWSVALSAGLSLAIFALSYRYFKRVERSFADVI